MLKDIHMKNVLTKKIAEDRAQEEQRVILTNALKFEMEDEAEEKRAKMKEEEEKQKKNDVLAAEAKKED